MKFNAASSCYVGLFVMSFVLCPDAVAQGTPDCNAADEAAMKTWFGNGPTPEPGPQLTSNTNCAFHVWSWQSFLYLTQTDPQTGRPRFLSLYTLDELFAPKGTDVVPASEKVLRLLPRVSKSDTTDFNEFLQAGSAGVLVDQQQRAVYYSQYVGPTFYNFVRQKFFRQQPGGTFSASMLAAATGADDFFPAGSLELKAAWKIVEDDSSDGFYTTRALIHLLKTQNGKIVVDPDRTREVRVALIGLHIAGVVEDHPEFIWATFEHRRNAPNLPHDVPPDSDTPVSSESWTFYKGGTPAKNSNVNPAQPPGTLQLNDSTQQLTPVTNIFRQFANGTTRGGPSAATNAANIEMLNQFVAEHLETEDSVWQHYFEGGAIWMLPNTLQPNQFPNVQLRGSTMLSNATMESYTQQSAQCFSCHNTQKVFHKVNGELKSLAGTNFNLSHILVNEYFRTLAQQSGVRVRSIR